MGTVRSMSSSLEYTPVSMKKILPWLMSYTDKGLPEEVQKGFSSSLVPGLGLPQGKVAPCQMSISDPRRP